VLPAAGPDPGVLGADVPAQRKDQAPRQLGRRAAQPAGTPDLDAEVAAGVEIDRSVGHPRRHEQLQLPRTGEHLPRQRGPLPHGDHDVGGTQGIGQLGVVQMAGPYVQHDIEVIDGVPRTEPGGDVLIIVEDQHAKGHTGILPGWRLGRDGEGLGQGVRRSLGFAVCARSREHNDKY
jgi:hypothetical protein